MARPGVTFHYGADGPVGHLKGKDVHIVLASGGVLQNSPADYATPHLRTFFGFLGMTNIEEHSAADLLPKAAA